MKVEKDPNITTNSTDHSSFASHNDSSIEYDQPLSFEPFEHGTVVVPPEEIKNTADKTAEYVAKHGANFEDKIKNQQINNPQFKFLWPKSQYYAYYRWMLNTFSQEKSKQEERQESQLSVYLFDPDIVKKADDMMDKVFEAREFSV